MKILDANCYLKKGETRALLEAMDQNGIEKAAISPEKNFIAVANRAGNAYVARAVRAHPDRFWGLAASNPWCGEKSLRELEIARDLGLSGLTLHPEVQGITILDPLVRPLLAFAAEAGWPVFCATGTPVYSMPFQLAERAEQFPAVPFVMLHGGFSDFWYDVPDTLSRCPNVWLETSYVLPTQISRLVAEFGAKRFVFGSDFPYSSIELELKKITRDQPAGNRNLLLRSNLLSIFEGTHDH